MANYFDKYDSSDADKSDAASPPQSAGGNYFDKYDPEPTPEAPPQPSNPSGADYVRSVMSGAAQLGQGAGYLGERGGEALQEHGQDIPVEGFVRGLPGGAVIAPFLKEIGGLIKQGGHEGRTLGAEAAQSWLTDRLDGVGLSSSGLSDTARKALNTNFLGEGKLGDKWNKAKLTAAMSIPGTLLGMGAGGGIAGGLAAAGAGARTAAAVGYGLGEAGVAAPVQGAQVEDQVRSMSDADLEKSPDYQATYAALDKLPEAERRAKAKDLVARAAGGDAAAMDFVTTFLLSAPLSVGLGKVAHVLPSPAGRLGAAVAGGLEEATQEALQSGAEQFGSNLAMRKANPNQDLMSGVLEQAAGGGIAGGLMGAVAGGAAGHTELEQVTPRTPGAHSPLDAIEEAQQKARAETATRGGDTLDQEVAAAMASSEASSHHAGAFDQAMAAQQHLDQTDAEYASGVAQQNEDAARAQIQSEAAGRYEAEIKRQKLEAPATTPDQAFAQAEAEQAARKETDTNKAIAQREEQSILPAEVTPTEAARPTLGETAPQVFKTLAERRAAEAAKTPEPVKAPEPLAGKSEISSTAKPTQVRVRAPIKEGGEWAVTIAGKPHMTYTSETAAKKSALQIRKDLFEIRQEEAAKAETPPVVPAGTKPSQTDTSLGAAPIDKGPPPGGAGEKVLLPAVDTPVESVQSPVVAGTSQVAKTLAERRAAEAPTSTQAVASVPATAMSIPTGASASVPTAAASIPTEAPVVPTAEQIATTTREAAAHPENSRPAPTQAQFQAGNYKMARLDLHGLPITIEYPKGSERPAGPDGTRTMPAEYGYIRGTKDADGMHTDVLIGPQPASPHVFVVDHVDTNGGFSQHKSLLGFPNQIAAARALKKMYPERKVGPITQMTVPEFKEWIKNGDHTKPLQPDKAKPASTPATPEQVKEAQSAVKPGRDSTLRYAEKPTTLSERKTLLLPKKASLDSVAEAFKDFHKEFGAESVNLLAHPRDLPAELRTRVEADGQTNARGMYDPETDTVYVFTENHENAEDAVRTGVHELVAHKGNRAVLGKDFEPTMQSVFDNATDRTWLDDFMTQHGLDAKSQTDQIYAADEYAASIAERGTDAGVLEKVVAAVRNALRKIGVDIKWTEADIRALLRKARSSLQDKKASVQSDKRLRYAGARKRTALPDGHPLQTRHNIGMTVEEQANYNPGFVRSRMDAIRDFGQNHIDKLLATVPRRNLADFVAPGKMPTIKDYIRTADRLDGRRNELLTAGEKSVKRWLKYVGKNKPGGRILGEMMHASTLAQVDPSREYEPLYSGKTKPLTLEQRKTESERKAQYAALKTFWNRMDEEGKAIFNEVRDNYAADRKLVEEGLEKRINDTAADEKTKQSLIAELRQKFEAGRVAGPYFPLARFGKHWAVAKKGDEVVSFSRFKKPSLQKAWRAEMEKAGYTTDGGEQADNNQQVVKQIDPIFVSKVMELLSEVDTELADEVWQHYLRSMPEMSMRKHFVHRKGRLGYTVDALRAYGHQKFHASHQIAKLEFMNTLEGQLEKIKVEARDLEAAKDPEAKWAMPLSKEMDLRHAWMRNPQNSAWSNALTALGFFYYLGTTPAAALVDLTQTVIVGLPVLAAEFNFTGASVELMRAARQYAGSRGPLANRLRGDERLAFDEAQRAGLFSQTRAADLAGVGEAGMDHGKVRTRVLEISSWLFSEAEEANRQVTFLAAYRLARRKGMSHEESILKAEDLTWDAHFQYQSTNRPRILQGDVPKVLGLFRQYSVNMTYRLARDFNDSLRGATPAAKKAARIRFAGILGQTMLHAGASGLPMAWLAYFIMNTLFGDDDKPYDAEGAMRAHLREHLGETAESAIMDGPISTLANVTLSNRVGLNNLWIQEMPENLEGTDAWYFYLGQAAGPLGGIGANAFDALKEQDDGYGDRALEKMLPKFLRDPLKALRYAKEGVQNLRGDTMVSPEDISTYDKFMQSIGFSPLSVSRQYEKGREIKGEERALLDRRTQVVNKLFLAAHNDDPQGTSEAWEAVRKFNVANPTFAIGAEALVASARTRAKYSAEAVNGIRVEPQLRYLNEKYGNVLKGADEDTQP